MIFPFVFILFLVFVDDFVNGIHPMIVLNFTFVSTKICIGEGHVELTLVISFLIDRRQSVPSSRTVATIIIISVVCVIVGATLAATASIIRTIVSSTIPVVFIIVITWQMFAMLRAISQPKCC